MQLNKNKLLDHLYLEGLCDRNPLVSNHRFLRLAVRGNALYLTITTSIYQCLVKVDEVVNESIDPFGVDALAFFSVIRNLSDDTVELNITDTSLIIKDSTLSVRLPIVGVDDLPPVESHKVLGERLFYGPVAVNWQKLLNFTSAEQGTYSGVFARAISDADFEVFATDRNNIYWVNNKSEAPLAPSDITNCILPKEFISAIGRLPLSSDTKLLLTREKDGQSIALSWGKNITPDGHNAVGNITSRLIFGSLPRIDAVINQKFSHWVVVNGRDLLNTLRLYLSIVDIQRVTITLTTDGQLTINEPDFKKTFAPVTFAAADGTSITISTSTNALIKVLTALTINNELVTINLSSDANFIRVFAAEEAAICSKIRGF